MKGKTDMKIVSVNTIRANALHDGMIFSFILDQGKPLMIKEDMFINSDADGKRVGVYIDKDFNAVDVLFDSEYHKLFLRRFGT